ncbi:5-methylcytosine-specific restriction enzyme subunit McrC [Devosia sp. YR412]|uniref:5-methylcytosine restriction system specificity protein McrC n=1 Tax=Devosia sp. YR412 TaxID=1881030 RepID=UPI0008AD2B90|nr:hypothetical protein [Devosia sp. YR412]SEP82207.1 5-methylcytosine-specific restriction enzyme subunit McrC [Devosia sp. YR412]
MTNSTIPIGNIYYLFAYAWNRFEEASAVEVGNAGTADLPNLLARVLLSSARSLLRRGLDRGYLPVEDQIATVRGRIAIGASARLRAAGIRRLHCEFDELSQDLHHNRVLKATLRRMAALATLDRELSTELIAVARQMCGVSDLWLRASDFAAIRLNRNNAHYSFLLRVAELAFDCLLPDDGGSGFTFRDVLRDERKMARVFEDFVRNFYRVEQREFSVEPLSIRWKANSISSIRGTPLPQMRVDVFLKSKQRNIIIDTKYYASALQTYYQAETVHSGNLYQLFSYLKNAGAQDETLQQAEGLLLYPCNGTTLNERFEVHGQYVTVATVDLNQPWQKIREQLLALISVNSGAVSTAGA